MAASKRQRFECFKRDKFACQYCGRTPPTVVLQADHIIAISNGGPDHVDNLVTACQDCNLGKSNIPLVSVPRPLAEVMEEAGEKQEQVDAYNAFLMEKRAVVDAHVDQLGTRWYDHMAAKPRDRGKYTFNLVRQQSIRQFLQRLPMAEVLEAVDIASSRIPGETRKDEKRWKYFCGVCWKKIRDAEGQ